MSAYADGRHARSSVLAQLRTDLATADSLGAVLSPAARETFHVIADAVAVSDRYQDKDHRMLARLRRLLAAEREAYPRYGWFAREACRRYVWRMSIEEKAVFGEAKRPSSDG